MKRRIKRQADSADEIKALRAEIQAMSARLAEADARATQVQAQPEPEPLTASPMRGHDLASIVARIEILAQRLDDTNARVTAVAAELAGQIDEIGRDGAPVEELRETQIHLAKEQARYQIQFNQGLAELADRLRGHTPGTADPSTSTSSTTAPAKPVWGSPTITPD